MKKILVTILAVTTIVLGYTAMAKAESINVPLSLTIPAEFGFTLGAYSHDFGTVDTGQGAETTIGIFCFSNHGRPWSLAVNADEFSNGTAVIPEGEAFTCSAWGDEGGEFAFEGTFSTFPMNVPVAPAVLYNSSVDEGGKPFVPITLGLYLNIPGTQDSGFYTTDLVITMTD